MNIIKIAKKRSFLKKMLCLGEKMLCHFEKMLCEIHLFQEMVRKCTHFKVEIFYFFPKVLEL